MVSSQLDTEMEDEGCEAYAEDSDTQAQLEVSGRAESPSWKNTVIDKSLNIGPQTHASSGIPFEGEKFVRREDADFSLDAIPFYSSYGYGIYAQEGHQLQPEEGYQFQPEEDYPAMPSETLSIADSTYYSVSPFMDSSHSEYMSDSKEALIRRRRAPSFDTPHGRIRKQRPASRRAANYQYINDEYSDDMPAEVEMTRSFPCPLAIYGCTSTFSAKNEWKRHVQTQHLRLGYWRCDQCAQGDRVDRKPNDFNRKDLFVQHIRRMHPLHRTSPSKKKSAFKVRGDVSDEHYLNNEANRCYRRLRDAPDSTNCVFCDQHFHGPCSWEERMEHIGRHMENAKEQSGVPVSPTSWRRDEEMEAWLLQARIIERYGDRLVLVGDSSGTRVPIHSKSEISSRDPGSKVQSQERTTWSKAIHELQDHQIAQFSPVADALPQMIKEESDKDITPEWRRQWEKPDTPGDEKSLNDSSSQSVSGRVSRLVITAGSGHNGDREDFAAGQSPTKKPLTNEEDPDDMARVITAQTSPRSGVKTLDNVDGPELLGTGAKTASLRAASRCFGCGQQLSTITARMHIDEPGNSACRQLYLILSQIIQSKITALQHGSSAHTINPSSPGSSSGRSWIPSCTDTADEEKLADLSASVEDISRLLAPNDVTRGADWAVTEQTTGGPEATSSSPASSSLDSRPRDSSSSSPRKRSAAESNVGSDDETTPQIKTSKKKRVDGDGIPCICCEHEGKVKKTDQDFYPSLGAMHRHVRSRHRKFMCEDCFTLFDDDDQREQHRLYGKDPCSKPCSSPSCRRRVRGSCKWRWVSEPCKHLVTTKCQWWAASNVIYDPKEEQASKQGRIDFAEPVWDRVLPDDIQEAFDSVIAGEKDARIAELEQDLQTTRQNLGEATIRLQSRQDLLYTLWQSLRAAGRADAYLCGMVQRAAPELLASDPEAVAGAAIPQAKPGTAQTNSPGIEQYFGSWTNSNIMTDDTTLVDSGIWFPP